MKTSILTLIVLYSLNEALAKDMLVQGRLFLANTKAKLTEVNTALVNEGLTKIDKTSNFGVEITFPISRFLEPGMRYTHRLFDADENPASPLNDFKARGKQDSILFLARFPFIRSSFLRFDIFAGVGGCNTTFKLKTASSDGEINKTAAKDWFASPYAATGASLGFGFRNVLFFAEGGYETNKVTKLHHSGQIHSNLTNIDLTGNYFMLGIMFDGIRGYKK